MTTTSLRKQIHEYVEQADDAVLKIVYMILEREALAAETEFSDEEKKLLDQRVHEIKSGKVKPVSQAEFHKILRKKLQK